MRLARAEGRYRLAGRTGIVANRAMMTIPGSGRVVAARVEGASVLADESSRVVCSMLYREFVNEYCRVTHPPLHVLVLRSDTP